MRKTILLIDDEPNVHAAAPPNAPKAADAIEACAPTARGLERLRARLCANDPPAAVLVGPGVGDPMAVSRVIERIAPGTFVVVLADVARIEQVARAASCGGPPDWAMSPLDAVGDRGPGLARRPTPAASRPRRCAARTSRVPSRPRARG
jgi:hypothetical protein